MEIDRGTKEATGCLEEGVKKDSYRRKRKVIIPREVCSYLPSSSSKTRVLKGKSQTNHDSEVVWIVNVFL